MFPHISRFKSNTQEVVFLIREVIGPFEMEENVLAGGLLRSMFRVLRKKCRSRHLLSKWSQVPICVRSLPLTSSLMMVSRGAASLFLGVQTHMHPQISTTFHIKMEYNFPSPPPSNPPPFFKGLRHPWMVLFEQAFRCHVFPTSRPRLQCFLELLYTFWIWRITMKQHSWKSEYVCGMKTYYVYVVGWKKRIRSCRHISKLVENTLIDGVL